MANWLRIGCSFIKRKSEGRNWEDNIVPFSEALLMDLLDRIAKSDPVEGVWCDDQKREDGRVWCDASSIGVGVALEVGGKLVEDASRLRKKDDNMHINVAELDAVLKGVNLALKWDIKKIEIMTDSATVRGWLHSLFTGSHRIRTHGAAEMLVKRRLSMLQELQEMYAVTISVSLVGSEHNKADPLTRVKSQWLRQVEATCCVCSPGLIKKVHDASHLGVQSTFYFAQLLDKEAKK